MEPELRSIVTTLHEPIETARQEVQEAFCVNLRALVGPKGELGEESFDFQVCSPAWLQIALNDQPILSGRSYLIMRNFDPEKIEHYVRKRIAGASGADWNEIAEKIGRWSHWEFEDYVEMKGS